MKVILMLTVVLACLGGGYVAGASNPTPEEKIANFISHHGGIRCAEADVVAYVCTVQAMDYLINHEGELVSALGTGELPATPEVEEEVLPTAVAQDYPGEWVELLTGVYPGAMVVPYRLFEMTKQDMTIEVLYLYPAQSPALVLIHPWDWEAWEEMLNKDPHTAVTMELIEEAGPEEVWGNP